MKENIKTAVIVFLTLALVFTIVRKQVKKPFMINENIELTKQIDSLNQVNDQLNIRMAYIDSELDDTEQKLARALIVKKPKHTLNEERKKIYTDSANPDSTIFYLQSIFEYIEHRDSISSAQQIPDSNNF